MTSNKQQWAAVYFSHGARCTEECHTLSEAVNLLRTGSHNDTLAPVTIVRPDGRAIDADVLLQLLDAPNTVQDPDLLDALRQLPPPTAGDGAWHSVWLHGDWRWLTRNMTTEQREHAADAVARYSAYLAQQDNEPGRGEPEDLRWWRDDQ